MAEVCSPEAKDAKRAELIITDIKQISDDLWELTIRLLTGRYHQIRAQLSALGVPIIGDTKYGSQRSFEPNGIALHHTEMAFQHPVKTISVLLRSEPTWRK